MNDQESKLAEAAIVALRKVTTDTAATAVARKLVEYAQGLRAGLELQVTVFPLAESGLRELVGTWIDEAELAVITFRETGVVQSIDIEAMVARAKRRYWAELVVVQKFYPTLPITMLHDTMSAEIDSFYPEVLQKIADQRNDQQARLSSIKDAELEVGLGESSLDEFSQKVDKQL